MCLSGVNFNTLYGSGHRYMGSVGFDFSVEGKFNERLHDHALEERHR